MTNEEAIKIMKDTRKCIQHIWKDGTSNPYIVFKYGRYSVFWKYCEVCGKRRLTTF